MWVLQLESKGLVLCVQCGKWIHGKYAVGGGNGDSKVFRKFYMQKMLERQWSRKKCYAIKWKQ